jgi:DNA invertase Pin-like site-specific DNA recombinase
LLPLKELFLRQISAIIPLENKGDLSMRRAGLYLRVSTNGQSPVNQERELREAARRLGHEVVEVYTDHGISGAKGRDQRPAFDKLWKDITRRKIDIVMAWSVDRLGRSLQHLVGFLEQLKDTKVDLYLHQQGLDTTTSAGRALFQMLGVFSELERSIIRERVLAGIHRAKERGTKSGKPIGRPALDPKTRAAIAQAYKKQKSLRSVAKQFDVGVETVRRCLTKGE